MARYVPNEFIQPSSDFGKADADGFPTWVLPQGELPERLYGAILQHVVSVGFARMIKASAEEDGLDDAAEFSKWFENREQVMGRTELSKDFLTRVLRGQDPIKVEDLAWLLMEVPLHMKPDWEEFFGELRRAKAVARPDDPIT